MRKQALQTISVFPKYIPVTPMLTGRYEILFFVQTTYIFQNNLLIGFDNIAITKLN